MIIDFCTVIFWTVLLAALLFYSLTNSTARPFAPPPFRGSLTVIALRQRCAPLHGGVGLAQKKSLLGFFWGLQKLKLLHAAKPPSVAFYVLARKNRISTYNIFLKKFVQCTLNKGIERIPLLQNLLYARFATKKRKLKS